MYYVCILINIGNTPRTNLASKSRPVPTPVSKPSRLSRVCRARFMGPVVAIVFSMGKRGVKTMGKTMMNIPVLLKIHGFDLYPNIWEFIYHEKSMSFFGTLICFKGGFSFDHRTWRLNQPRFGFNRPTCRPNQSKLEDYINHIETMNIWIFF